MEAAYHKDIPKTIRTQCESKDFHTWIQSGPMPDTRDSTTTTTNKTPK